MKNYDYWETLKHRDDLPYWLNEQGLLGVGIECGVHKGYYSYHIRTNWKGRLMFGVDTYHPTTAWDLPTQEQCDAVFNDTKAWLEGLGGYELIRRDDVAFGKTLADESLDFVYLDTTHKYDDTINQLNVWWSKIKPGGVLGGHDWVCPSRLRVCNFDSDVFQAVNEFVAVQRLDYRAFHNAECPANRVDSFWIRKPL